MFQLMFEHFRYVYYASIDQLKLYHGAIIVNLFLEIPEFVDFFIVSTSFRLKLRHL